MRAIRLFISQSEKGGSGKTTVKEALVAGLMAGGAQVVVADADDGNSGYIRRAGKASAIALPWSVGADALSGWLANNLGDCDTLAIDCGANIIASGAPVNEFLGELIVRVVEAGGSVVTLAVASTNAPGTGRLVRQMRDAYGDYARVTLVQNDQNGSATFSRSLATLGMPTVTFPHVAPGIQAARLLSVAPLIDVLRTPPDNYATAACAYADAVARFIAEPAISDLFGADALPTMRALAAKAPGALAKVVYRLTEATDRALAANHAVLVARRILWQTIAKARDDRAAVGDAALALDDAERAYCALIR